MTFFVEGDQSDAVDAAELGSSTAVAVPKVWRPMQQDLVEETMLKREENSLLG